MQRILTRSAAQSSCWEFHPIYLHIQGSDEMEKWCRRTRDVRTKIKHFLIDNKNIKIKREMNKNVGG
jgi:hypothetical protein